MMSAPYKVYEGDELKGTYATRAEERDGFASPERDGGGECCATMISPTCRPCPSSKFLRQRAGQRLGFYGAPAERRAHINAITCRANEVIE